MNRSIIAATVFLAAALATPAFAQDVTAGNMKISAQWTRATPKGATVGGGYMKITNTGTTADRLVGGSSAVSARFEMHEMSMEGGVMKMRELSKGLEIKPGQTIEFKPGGYHVMFMGLKQQFMPGERIKATLQFEKAGKVDVDFSVAGVGAQGPDAAAGAHGGGHMKH
jgi:copper(I)-binding protein